MSDCAKACIKFNNPKITACFKLNILPDKVSQLENDLKYQTEEQVQETVNTAINEVNARIDGIEESMVDTVIGSELIGVTRDDNTVTLTSKNFVFEQALPSTEWVINHNLNKRPSIELTDYNGERFEAYKEYTSNNQVIIRLDSAATGYAYLN